MAKKKYRLGIDVGGTFTDFTLLDEKTGQLNFYKLPSTPSDPSRAVEEGLGNLIEICNLDPLDIEYVGHGTTVALNMLLEQRAPKIGLLTTKGFRDVLEIGRQTRPHLYDYDIVRPSSLARRVHTKEIKERISIDGEILTRIDLEQVESAALQLKKSGISGVAICFLHAYRFPEHEILASEIVQRVLPKVFVSLSSEVLPEFREFERASTTAVNTYVGPQMKLYLSELEKKIQKKGISRRPYIIHSNGGLLAVNTAAKFPVRTCLSGPAAGVVGASAISAVAGEPNVLTFDVGGTSTDVSLVLSGKPLFTSERTVAGYPVKSPAIDVSAIGAGGGSIAWIDSGGALKVGPQSAGADPGPVAYGQGGADITLTDANIILGRLNPNTLLGGNISLDVRAANDLMETQIATPLGISVEAAAIGIIKVASSGIARAIRSVASAKGHNPSEFCLFAYGGAGPLLATDVNEEVGCLRIMVPREPGNLCARGILLSDLTFDYVRTVLVRADENNWERVVSAFRELEKLANKRLIKDDIPEKSRAFRFYIEARYEGQSFEVRLEIPSIKDQLSLAEFIRSFHAEHKKEFSYDIAERNIEVVNCRLEAIGKTHKPSVKESPTVGNRLRIKEMRNIHFGTKEGWHEAAVYERETLPSKKSVVGPAVIEEMSSTTIIPPNHEFILDSFGNLILGKT